MPNKRMRFGKWSFPSQKAFIRFMRAMSGRYKDYETVRGEDHEFLLCLFSSLHRWADEKFGVGVKRFFFAPVPGYSRRNKGLWLERVDGTITDISWQSEIVRRPEPNQDAQQGFRTAIKNQEIEARDEYFRKHVDTSGRVPCQLSGVLITKDEAEVHHDAPDFAELVRAFLRTKRISLEDVQVVGNADGDVARRLADRKLEREFQDFHRRHARLLVVSRTAHRRLRRKRPR